MNHAKLNKMMKAADNLDRSGKHEQAAKLRDLVADFCGEFLFPGVVA